MPPTLYIVRGWNDNITNSQSVDFVTEQLRARGLEPRSIQGMMPKGRFLPAMVERYADRLKAEIVDALTSGKHYCLMADTKASGEVEGWIEWLRGTADWHGAVVVLTMGRNDPFKGGVESPIEDFFAATTEVK
jgi:hypothetical protein